MSFDWVTITANGIKRNEVYFNTGEDVYTLSVKGPMLTLSYGWDKVFTIGFLSEYNTSEEFISKQCEEIDQKVRNLVLA